MPKHIFLFFLGLFLCVSGCDRAPIKVGALIPLQGRLAHFGINGRNAIQLAIEELNAAGGINGRKLVLIIENSAGSPEESLAAAKRLVEQDVVGIIGPSLSEEVIQLKPFWEKQTTLPFISPTVTTEKLSGLKDNFFRIESTSPKRAQMLADYITDERLIKDVLVVGNKDNLAYTKSFNDAFIQRLEEQNGSVTDEINLSFVGSTDWTPILKSLEENPADAILINARGVDAASLAQTLRSKDIYTQIMCPSGAFHDTVLRVGGRDVEGMIFAASYDPTSDYPPYLDFIYRFKKRYGEVGSSFNAVYAYEAAQLLFYALQQTKGKQDGMIDALRSGPTIEGLYGPFSLDEFGDVERKDFLMTIRNGQFVNVRRVGR